MDLMQLKAPPDLVELMANAIERDIKANPDIGGVQQLNAVLTWLRYRLAKWKSEHPDPTPA